MFNYFRIAVISVFVVVLMACGGEGNDSTPAIDIPGDTRVARVVTSSSSGIQSSATYRYDEGGRLQTIASTGEEGFVMSYLYDTQGRLVTREDNYTNVNRRDTFREYLYEGDRPTGYIESGFFDDPISAVTYRYSGTNIVGYDHTNLDEFNEHAVGVLIATGTYAFSDMGHIDEIIVDDMHTRIQRVTSFVTNAFGQRLSDETVNSVSPAINTSVWEYEERPCIELPFGIVYQWVCVQTF